MVFVKVFDHECYLRKDGLFNMSRACHKEKICFPDGNSVHVYLFFKKKSL